MRAGQGHGRSIDALQDLVPTADLRPLADVRAPTGASRLHQLAPGLAFVAIGVAAAFGVHAVIPVCSPLVASVVFGAVAANSGLVSDRRRPGAHFAAKRLLRIGIALLGLQLSISEVLGLGARGLAVVAGTVAITFFGTRWLGRRLGLSPGLSLLVATGFSICGASAIAAVETVADADEDEVAFSIGLVTVCGTLAIVVLPLLRHPLALSSAARFGSWVGASVHDIGQVVATASSGGPAALRAAVVVKLTRVLLLGPLVAALSFGRRRQVEVERRAAAVPLFVYAFAAAVVIRSTGWIPAGWLPAASVIQTVALSAALVGLGTGVQLRRLRQVGGRPLVLGLCSWVLVAGAAYGGVALIGH